MLVNMIRIMDGSLHKAIGMLGLLLSCTPRSVGLYVHVYYQSSDVTTSVVDVATSPTVLGVAYTARPCTFTGAGPRLPFTGVTFLAGVDLAVVFAAAGFPAGFTVGFLGGILPGLFVHNYPSNS